MDYREKLEAELNFSENDKKVNAVKSAVCNTLIDFCEQEHEFAQAIEQSDKSLIDCCKHCVAGSGSSISDMEVYKKAVEFYFPTATINFSMKINLCGDTGYEPPPIEVTHQEKSSFAVSLDSLLDF